MENPFVIVGVFSLVILGVMVAYWWLTAHAIPDLNGVIGEEYPLFVEEELIIIEMELEPKMSKSNNPSPPIVRNVRNDKNKDRYPDLFPIEKPIIPGIFNPESSSRKSPQRYYDAIY